jgi:hypothetical protein
MKDALGKTHHATTVSKKRQWAATANSVLTKTGDEGQAVRVANAAVKKGKSSKKPVHRGRGG